MTGELFQINAQVTTNCMEQSVEKTVAQVIHIHGHHAGRNVQVDMLIWDSGVKSGSKLKIRVLIFLTLVCQLSLVLVLQEKL